MNIIDSDKWTSRKRKTETENGNGKRTGQEWTGLTQNSAFISVGQKLSILIKLYSLSCLHSLLSCLSLSRYRSKVTCIFNELQQ